MSFFIFAYINKNDFRKMTSLVASISTSCQGVSELQVSTSYKILQLVYGEWVGGAVYTPSLHCYHIREKLRSRS